MKTKAQLEKTVSQLDHDKIRLNNLIEDQKAHIEKAYAKLAGCQNTNKIQEERIEAQQKTITRLEDANQTLRTDLAISEGERATFEKKYNEAEAMSLRRLEALKEQRWNHAGMVEALTIFTRSE